eukprot:10960361-Ditylum_brightwellii.AAC.1
MKKQLLGTTAAEDEVDVMKPVIMEKLTLGKEVTSAVALTIDSKIMEHHLLKMGVVKENLPIMLL